MEALQQDHTLSNLTVMLLPLQTDHLLLPDVMIAEIFEPGDIEVKVESPEWFVGYIQWRGQAVPLISFEALNGSMAVPAALVQHVAIVESTLGHGHLPQYAVVVSGRPTILDITDDQIKPYEGRPRGRAEVMSVMLDQKTAGIPNVNWVEQHLQTFILHR
jgi:chemosensory pili system protein ChpC